MQPHKQRHIAGPVMKSVIVAQIDKDHLWEPGDSVASKVGMRWVIPASDLLEMFPDASKIGLTKTRFRILDDDGIVYYGGWLYNDADCDIQLQVSQWAAADSGAPLIQVKDPNDPKKWVFEIG